MIFLVLCAMLRGKNLFRTNNVSYRWLPVAEDGGQRIRLALHKDLIGGYL